MWCPNCGANVRSGPTCERCGAPLPSEGRQAKVRVEGARQRAARRATEREQNAQDDGRQQGGANKRRGGTLADFFNAQAQRQATRDRIPAAPATPAAPQPNQKVRRSWLPIRTRLSSGPIRGNAAKRGGQSSALPQFPQYPAQPEIPPTPTSQAQQHESSYEGYRQQAYDHQQAYDQPPQAAQQWQQAYESAQQVENQSQQQNYSPAGQTYDQDYSQGQQAYEAYGAYGQNAPYDRRYEQEQQESQADIDDAWEVGYRAALGTGEDKGGRRGRRKEKSGQANIGRNAAGSMTDRRAMGEPSDDDLRSPARSWNIIGAPQVSQHISGPLANSRYHAPMVPLEEIAAMPVAQGYPGDMRMNPRARPRPQQVVAGMSRMTFNLILLGLVLCILAVPAIIGLQRLAAISPSASPTVAAKKTVVPTPQLAQGFSGFLNDDFSIAYPSTWQRATPSGASPTVSFTDGKDTSAKVTILNALPATELQQHLDEIAHGFNGVVPQVISTGQRKSYNKAVWLENDYLITLVKGSKTLQIELRVLTIDYGAKTFDILLSTPRSDFANVNRTYFEPMLQSIRFQ